MIKQWARRRALQPNFAKIASQVAGKGQKEPPINTQLAQFRGEQIKPRLLLRRFVFRMAEASAK